MGSYRSGHGVEVDQFKARRLMIAWPRFFAEVPRSRIEDPLILSCSVSKHSFIVAHSAVNALLSCLLCRCGSIDFGR